MHTSFAKRQLPHSCRSVMAKCPANYPEFTEAMNKLERYAYTATPQRVLCGAGTARDVGAELLSLERQRAVVISTPGQQALGVRIHELLGNQGAGVLATARVHVPTEVVEAGLDEARRMGADSLIAVGGGSAIGLAKALAVQTGWPIVALPTTYAGSEATPIFGLTLAGIKRTGRDARALPNSVIYDTELSAALPKHVSVASALNGTAHAMEALYASDRSPMTDALARHGLRLFASGLDALSTHEQSPEVRSQLSTAAWLCGHVLGQTQMGLHHKLCHVLGGRFDLPHAELHALMLPRVLELTAARRPELVDQMADAMGVADPAYWCRGQLADAGLPVSLTQLGIEAVDVGEVADLVMSQPYPHPFTVGRQDLLQLLREAVGA